MYFDCLQSATKEEIEKYKSDLEEMIMNLLSNSKFTYYQGYHEICGAFLLILGKESALEVMRKVSNYQLVDYLRSDFKKSITAMLEVLRVLIQKVDTMRFSDFCLIEVI